MAAVIFFWRVAARVLGGWPLMGALLLFAASPALTWHGGNVKPYAGDVAFTLLLVLVALRFDEHPDDRGRAAMGGVAGAVAALFSFPAVLTAAVAGLVLLGRWRVRRPCPPAAPLLAFGGPWLAGIVAAGVLAMRQLDPETKAYMNRFWVDGFAPAPWTSIDALLWVPAREPVVIRSYLAAIGTERERIPDPFGGKDQSEAAAYLYDLSDPVRLAAGTAADHRFPEPRTGRPRVLCDGTRLPGGP